MEIAIVLTLLAITILLFASGKVAVDVVTVGMLIILTSIGILTPSEAFRGFGSDFIIMLASIFVVSAAIKKSGALEMLGNRLTKPSGNRNVRVLPFSIMSTVGLTSAFINNTTVTALYISPVISICRKLKISPSKLLMPVAYASILGGTCTVIGTSTNIAVNAYLGKHGYETFGMFDFVTIGLVMMVAGIIYMMAVGIRLLPGKMDVTMIHELEQKHFFTEIKIKNDSALSGLKIRDTLLSKEGYKILAIIRDKQKNIASGYSEIESNDVLLVEGNFEYLLENKDRFGYEITGQDIPQDELETDDFRIVELLVTPDNDFVGQTVREAEFKRRFGILVMAVNREGQTLSDKINDIEIKIGDRLLIQGPAVNIEYRRKRGDFKILNEIEMPAASNNKAWLSILFFAIAIILATSEIIPVSSAFMLAAFMCVVFKIIKPEEAYQKIEWSLLVLIGGMSSFGIAMEKTGTAAFLAGNLISFFDSAGPMAVLAGFSILTVLLTQPLSNAAAAMVVLPVALNAADTLGVSSVPFALTVMLSASVSLITPFEPSCILVYGPGNYKFMDYLRTGFPATVLMIAIILLMVPLLYPL